MIKIKKNIKDEPISFFEEIDAVLKKRQQINDRYLRGITSTTVSDEPNTVQIFFEKFITDLAAGYLSGEITYNVEIVDAAEEPAYRLLHPNAPPPLNPDTAAQLKYLLHTLSAKNDDKTVLKSLFHDAVLYGACYERQVDLTTPTSVSSKDVSVSSGEPNYTYYPLSALNTVAIFPTDIADTQQQNAIALVTVYNQSARNSEDNQEHTLYCCIECNPYTDTYQTSIYDKTTHSPSTSPSQSKTIISLKEEIPTAHHIPTFAVFEPDPQVSIIDPIINLVTHYEEIMNNLNNLYHYNDADAKLKISGYRPENSLMIPNPSFDPDTPISMSNPDMILNPARMIEDDYLLKSKTFFVQERRRGRLAVKGDTRRRRH